MATATPTYGTPTAFTWTIASKASDTNLLAGFESTAIDQKDTLDAIDVLVGGKITTGTGPTASRQIQIWAYASWDDAEFSGGCAGSDGAKTLTAESKQRLFLVDIIATNSTSDTAYTWGPYSALKIFQSAVLPVQFGLWFVHNTGVNLNATAGNHEAFYTTVKFESA